MAEALRANMGSKSAILLQRGPVDPIFQVEGGFPTNRSSSQKTRLNDIFVFIFIQFTAIKSNQKQHNDKNNTAEGQPGHKMTLMATHT